MEKSARKKSNDPIQEHLREHKAVWNEEVSTLIDRLISLKRVMNGKADDTIGIPSSNIKDPMPPQVGSAISALQNGSGEIFNKARAIVEEQAQYSEHRQKSKKATSLEDLVKEASWFGSRLVSRLSRLELSKEERLLRNRIINNAVEQWDLLLEMEEDVGMYSAEEDISRIFSKTSSMLSSYEALLRRFSKLYKLKNDLDKDKNSDIEESPTIQNEPEEKTEEEINSNDKTEIPEPSDIIDENIIKKFQKIKNNREALAKMLQILSQDEDLDPSEKKWFKEGRAKLLKAINFLDQKIEKLTADSSLDVLEKLNVFFVFVDEIQKRIYAQKDFLGADFQAIEVNAFNKEADIFSPIKRWLGKNLLKLKTKDFAPMRLDIVESSISLRQSFDKFLDVLENKNSSASELLNALDATRLKWLELGKFIILLGQKYHFEERAVGRGRDINTTDFGNLLSLLRKIQNYAP